MRYDLNKHHRRSIRLRGWDYSSEGIYCLTACIQHRECLLGEVVNGQTVFSEWGQIVADEWERTQHIRQEIEFDEWVIMPNHFHAIIRIINPGGSGNPIVLGYEPGQRPLSPTGVGGDRPRYEPGQRPLSPTGGGGDRPRYEPGQRPLSPTGVGGDRPRMRPKSVSSLMAGFKSITTARINTLRQTPGAKVWQRNYYDSIIRTERGLEQIREYIRNNPKQWEIDQLHPQIPSKW